MIHESVFSMIGNTPLVEIKTDEITNARILVKLESLNPTGSVKDRAAVNNIRTAEANGDLDKSKTILDASSGNMACALAYYGKILGYNVKLICNTKLTDDKRQFIEYFGAELDVFGQITYEGNQKCKELAEQYPDKYCFLDQLHNWANPEASYETLGPEIFRDVPDVKAVVGSMGSGGSMCGAGGYFKDNHPEVRIFTAQAASGTKIPGTGAFIDGDYKTPFIDKMYDEKILDDSLMVHLEEAHERTKQMRDQGIFVGIQGGAVLHTTISMINKHGIQGDVVMVIGDSGWKNMEKLKAL